MPGSALGADPPVARCDEDAGGLELPVALSTTMVAMATTTSPTGTSAAIRGWRERKLAARGAVGGAEREVPLLAARFLVDWFLVDWFLVDWFLVGCGDRAGPVMDFDMWFSSIDRSGGVRRVRRLDAEAVCGPPWLLTAARPAR